MNRNIKGIDVAQAMKLAAWHIQGSQTYRNSVEKETKLCGGTDKTQIRHEHG